MSNERHNTSEQLRQRAEALFAKSPEDFQPEDIEDLKNLAHELTLLQAELESKSEALRKIEWMLTPEHAVPQDDAVAPYGDLTELNTERTILDGVGPKMLEDIVRDYLYLLDTSAAVYERNGDYALGIFASSWCRFLDGASRRLCNTDDNADALACGKWHCHESCWKDAAKAAIESGKVTDIECAGGLRMYAVPIRVGERIIGAINFGYGNPPRDPNVLRDLAAKYEVPFEELAQHAEAYQSRPDFIIDKAKHRIKSSARLIGEIVERRQYEKRIDHFRRVLLGIRNLNQLVLKEDDPQRMITEACLKLSETGEYRQVWIALLGGKAGSALGLTSSEPVVACASAGFDGDFAAMREHLIRGEFPSCMKRALKTDRIVATNDPAADCIDCPVYQDFNVRSQFARSLKFNSITYGILTAAVSTDFFNEVDERNFFNEVADDLAFALHNIAADRRLRESEAYQRQILQTTADGFWVIGNEGQIIDVNDAYCAMTGYTRDALLNMRIGDLDAEEEPEETQARMERIMQTGHEIFETTHRRKDGSLLPVEITATYLKERQGQFICFCRDLTRRKQGQARRRLFGRLLDEAPAAITIHDTDGHFVFANKATASMHGYESVQEFLKINLHDLDLPESEELLDERVRKIKETGEARFEVTHYRKDGSTFPLEVQAKIIDWEGKPAILSIATDITESKQAEENLRESQQRLSLATQSAALGIWDWDIVNNDMTWDDQMFRLYGITERPETYGVEIWENGLHPDDKAFAWEACQAALRREKDYDIEFRVCWPDGTTRHLKGHGIVIRDETGNPIRMLGTNADITERKEAEAELRAYERLNSSLLDHSPACHKVVDLDFNLQYMSKNGFCMLKLDEDAVVYGKPYPFSFFPEAFKQEMVECLKRVKTSGKTEVLEAQTNDIEGNVVWLHSTLVPVFKDDRELDFITVVSSDMTQEKQLESNLLQSQKMESVGRLAGGVAHDFNNMLNVIMGHSELVLETLDSDSPLLSNLTEIHKAAEHSADLTRQLLAFARKQTIKPQVLDLNETILSMLKILHRLIGEDIDLLWKPAGRLDSVNIDPGQVDQILANLAVNARDAIGHENGKITIETSNVHFDEEYCAYHPEFTSGNYVMLAISDDGCGMDEETRSHIFEPFYTTKATGEGTGLGLATIYGIIRQNNGFINVYSELGQGTSFQIYLPAIENTAEKNNEQRNADQSPLKGNETILIVEDEPAILKLAQMALERLGYCVLTATKPSDALDIAQDPSNKIDLVITDIIMPEINGRELVCELEKCCSGIHSLYMSGYTADVIAHQGVLEEGVNFIQKPFSPRDLAHEVRRALEKND